jgi:hypothetical protein
MFLRAREALLSQRNAYHSALIPGTRLNYFLGADEYDRLFVGFEILHIENEVLTLSVRPACTNEVQDKYLWHVAIVAETLLRHAIRKVNVIPLDESRSSRGLPAR